MAPLSMIGIGQSAQIDSIHGKEETRRFLENLGFAPGTKVSVVSELNGDVIVNVKDSRIAISKPLAARIFTI